MKQVSYTKIIGYAGLILFLGFVNFYLIRVDVSLIYYWQQTVALSFGEYLQYPGGISDLAAIHFNELSFHTFWSNGVFMALLGAIYFALHRIFRQYLSMPFHSTLLLAALSLVMLLMAHYRFPTGLLFSLLFGLFIATGYTIYRPKNIIARIAYIFLLGLLTYLVAGSAGLLVLLQICIIKILFSGKYSELLFAIPLLVLVPVFYLIFNNCYTLRMTMLSSFLISKYDEIPNLYYFSLFIPFILLVIYWGLNFLFSGIKGRKLLLFNGIGTIILLLVLPYLSIKWIDKEEKTVLQIEKASFEDDWNEVIELASGESLYNKLIQFEVNRALYHKGILLEKMFSYPQLFGEKSLFLEENFSGRIAFHASDFYFDMGYATEFRHWANESHMLLMRHPIVLKELIVSYLALGKENASLKYLGILYKSNPHKDWCDEIYSLIEEGDIQNNPLIQSFIINDPKSDFFATTARPVDKIRNFYRSNPNNNVAFEFLMASYLLKHQLEDLSKYIPDLIRFGYDKIPKAVEEAIMIYMAQNQANNIDLGAYSISRQTIEEFQDFSMTMANTRDRNSAMQSVAKYRNTYWYYVLFSSPYAKKQ